MRIYTAVLRDDFKKLGTLGKATIFCFQAVGATYGFVPQSPSREQALLRAGPVQKTSALAEATILRAAPPVIALDQALVSNGWRHPWVCAAVSGCGANSPPPMNSRVPCDSAVAKYACLKRLAPPMGLCRSLRMRRELCLNLPMGLRRSLRTRHELSAAYEFTRSV